MNSDDLSKEQLAKLSDGLKPGRDYLLVVRRSLFELGIPLSDPMMQRVIVAIEATKNLNDYVHFAMGDLRPPKERE